MNKYLSTIRDRARSARSEKGFSLIEMLVAMAIFVIFTGLLINSYMGIVKALRVTEEQRIVYSEARHVFDVLTEEARNATNYGGVYGDCNPNGLEFCSAEGKVTFVYDEYQDVLKIIRGGAFKEALHSDEIKITSFRTYVWPEASPFVIPPDGEDFDEYLKKNLYQPKVTFVATFEKVEPSGKINSYDLQTSVSLRTYN